MAGVVKVIYRITYPNGIIHGHHRHAHRPVPPTMSSAASRSRTVRRMVRGGLRLRLPGHRRLTDSDPAAQRRCNGIVSRPAPGTFLGMDTAPDYLATLLPRTIPAGRVLVHNNVRPTRKLGSRGFRAWLALPDTSRLTRCECEWAPELGQHFRVNQLEGDDQG